MVKFFEGANECLARIDTATVERIDKTFNFEKNNRIFQIEIVQISGSQDFKLNFNNEKERNEVYSKIKDFLLSYDDSTGIKL